MFRRILLLTITLTPCVAIAQTTRVDDRARMSDAGVAVKNWQTDVTAAAGPRVAVSKTAIVDGQNVCGVIRVTNGGGQPVLVTAIADSLEVHFSRTTPPAPLPAGSTANWFKLADVPIPLPGPIAPGETVVIDYCFSLCLAADYAGANSMRNVVAISAGELPERIKTFTTRSVSFPPPILDCQACCLPDGSCTDTLPDECAGASGLSQGSGTDCDTTECTQACCLGDGTCSNETVGDCEDDGGAPLGLGTTCATVTTTCRGACCTGAGCVDDVSDDECRLAIDLQGMYLGNDTTCASELDACPTGACCEGGTGLCRDDLQPSSHVIHSNQHQCEIGFGGTYLGDGTTCATVTTTCRGACCTSAGCADGVDARECRFLLGSDGSGTYLGNDTTCASQAGACPTGACCEGGTGLCRDDLQPSSHVIHSNQHQCEIGFGGTYLGDGTICTSTSCNVACCFGSSCEELDPIDCEAQGGDPQVPGTDCGFLGISPCSVIIDP